MIYLKQLLEITTPTKPVANTDGNYLCPSCNAVVGSDKDGFLFDYCPCCGQALEVN